MRIEHDQLGDHAVPAEAYYGIHTARAVENFPLLGQPLPPALVAGDGDGQAGLRARPTATLGLLDPAMAGAIARPAGN